MPSHRTRVAVYRSSLGNYFFAEIARLLACGLRESGCAVVERDERRGFEPGADVHLVVAPHEFFYMGAGRALRSAEWPDRVVLYNTEQPSSPWYPLARRVFSKARALWDLDWSHARELAQAGWPCAHLPLGWAPSCELFSPKPAARPWARRSIDVLFVGGRTARRERFFSREAEALSRHRGRFHLVDVSRPVTRETAPLGTSALLALARDAKIVLNVHRDHARYFEWHRLAVHGIGQGALVVSELASPGPPFEPGVHFVEAPLADIPGTLRRYLDTRRGRLEAARIARRGLEAYRRSCRLSDLLPPLLARISADGAPPVVSAPAPRATSRRAEAEVVWSRRRAGAVPRATIAVTLHDYRRFIAPCLESARAQTLRALDLVVVDDASSDGSDRAALRWLERRGARFARAELLRHRVNQGLARSRNAAFARARTDLVFVLDADNLIFPTCLEKLVRALDSSKASFAYSHLKLFGDEDGLMNTRPWNPAAFRTGNYIDAMALVRRSEWRRVGGYREDLSTGWEDYDFWLRLARAGGSGLLVPEALAAYRVHLGSMLSTVTRPDAAALERFFRDEHRTSLSAPRPLDAESDHYSRIAAGLLGAARRREKVLR